MSNIYVERSCFYLLADTEKRLETNSGPKLEKKNESNHQEEGGQRRACVFLAVCLL
jgi:hypothetical protein